MGNVDERLKPADESLRIKTKHASNNALACPVFHVKCINSGSCTRKQRRYNMKLNKNTQRAANICRSYDNASIICLTEAYKNPSISKQRAYADCIKKMHEMNGYGFRIMGYNSCFFTVGWLYTDPRNRCYHAECRNRI